MGIISALEKAGIKVTNNRFSCIYTENHNNGDKNPSAVIMPSGKAYCFTCRKPYGIKDIEKRFNIKTSLKETPIKIKKKKKEINIQEDLIRLYKGKDDKETKEYLESRGFEKIPKRLFVTNKTLIIPYYNIHGELSGYQRRLTFKKSYTFPEGSKMCLSRTKNIADGKIKFITESIIDMYLINSLGFPCYGYPSAYYKLTKEESDFIDRSFIFLPDKDMAGEGLAKYIKENTKAKVLNDHLEGCKDFGEYILKNRKRAIKILNYFSH